MPDDKNYPKWPEDRLEEEILILKDVIQFRELTPREKFEFSKDLENAQKEWKERLLRHEIV